MPLAIKVVAVCSLFKIALVISFSVEIVLLLDCSIVQVDHKDSELALVAGEFKMIRAKSTNLVPNFSRVLSLVQYSKANS